MGLGDFREYTNQTAYCIASLYLIIILIIISGSTAMAMIIMLQKSQFATITMEGKVFQCSGRIPTNIVAWVTWE